MTTRTVNHSVTVEHTFEAAHRLPHIGGKCRNLHGHSWRAAVTIAAPTLSDQYTVAEFSAFKKLMRGWIDEHLDHGAMLGDRDALLNPLVMDGCKVFVFGLDWDGATWPTVEAVAALLADKAAEWLTLVPDLPEGAQVLAVTVSETPTNRAGWVAP